jgi:hypothetical protein
MELMWKILVVGLIFFLSATTAYFYWESTILANQPKETTKLPIEEVGSASPTYDDRIVLDIISGTEYSPNEEGQFIVRLVDQKSRPLSGACYGSIAYPDKSLFISNQSMSASAFSGNYYIAFIIPDTYGIYEELTVCYVNTSSGLLMATKASTFHVTNTTAILTEINDTIMNKLYAIQGEISSMQSNIITSITNTENNIIASITSYYNSLYSLITNLPTQVITQIGEKTPDWFSCIAQKVTGVYPVGSKC